MCLSYTWAPIQMLRQTKPCAISMWTISEVVIQHTNINTYSAAFDDSNRKKNMQRKKKTEDNKPQLNRTSSAAC